MSATPAVSDVKAALTAAVGADAVSTAPEELEAYAADTYWPALAANAAGAPMGRPDIVVRPRTEDDVAAVVAAAHAQHIPVVAWGGGSGTQGGALAIHGGIVLDLGSLDVVLNVDETSMTVTAQAGVNGRRLESELNARGLMLPHYPASVEWATVGGYIAARGSGVLSTRYGKIEDLLLTLRVATPATGLIQTVQVPRHAVGPELTQLFVGSEGTLGVITEAWVRLQDRPEHRASAGVRFPTFAAGADAVRAVSQAGLYPSNCRLLDPAEAKLTSGGDGKHALFVLGFESADHDPSPWMERALELCEENGGEWDTVRSGGREGSVGAWRDAFLRAPYLRDTFVAMGVLSETFETAITWERFPAFHETVTGAAQEAVRETYGAGTVTCRFTHVYPDGPAPYFTILAPARRGEELEQWEEVKAAASDAVIEAGGTITHHHAVGRDHRPWYDRQRPDPFAAALIGAKAAVDPRGVLNPGVLVDPQDPAP
jgi:alkyldihydroxyacetonephosphate synthase